MFACSGDVLRNEMLLNFNDLVFILLLTISC